MSDGSDIDVAYVGEKSELEIVQDEAACPTVPIAVDPLTSSSGRGLGSVAKKNSLVIVLASTAMSLAVIPIHVLE